MSDRNEDYRLLLRAIDARGIRYAVLRDDLGDETPIRDLDLLIDGRRKREFLEIAAVQGFHLIRDNPLNPGKFVLCKAERDDAKLIDVHERVIYKGFEFLNTRLALTESVQRRSFYYLRSEHMLIGLLLHNVLAKRRIQEKHLRRLLALRDGPLDERFLRAQLRAYGLERPFFKLLPRIEEAAAAPGIAEDAAKEILRILRRRPVGNVLRRAGMWLNKCRVKVIGRRRGVLLAVLGPDGAGKSTMIDAMLQELKATGFSCTTAYMGPWGGSLLKLRTVFKRFGPSPYRDDYKPFDRGETDVEPGPLPFGGRLKFFLRSRLYYVLLWLEMRARWHVRVLPALRQGKLVLCDRYMYDILVGYKNRPMPYDQPIRERMCERFPRPDIGILLDASPDIIFQRKPQFQVHELQAVREVYHRIAERFEFVVLDTSESVASTISAFQSTVVPRLVPQAEAPMTTPRTELQPVTKA